jgi:predicted O-methyltransferase YrrM
VTKPEDLERWIREAQMNAEFPSHRAHGMYGDPKADRLKKQTMTISKKEKQEFLESLLKEYEGVLDGKFFYERLLRVSEFCKSIPGDCVEIGCHEGLGSLALAQGMGGTEKILHCIDPWDTGAQQCRENTFDIFTERTKSSNYADKIVAHRLDSRSKEAGKLLKSMTLSLALVDGLHTTEAAFNDIENVMHTDGIIIVDDMIHDPGVIIAVDMILEKYDITLIRNKGVKEAFLIV